MIQTLEDDIKRIQDQLETSKNEINQKTIKIEELSQALLRSEAKNHQLEHDLNSKAFEHELFVELQEQHLQRKLACMKAYGSQQFRHYMRDETLRALAVVRGMQIGAHYAEAFEVIRMVIR